MESIICLGTPACKVGRLLDTYKRYRVLYIDDEGRKRKGFCKVEKRSHPEEYEERYDLSVDTFLKSVKGEVTFIVCGASLVSSMSLRLLEPIATRGASIRILYIRPQVELLSEAKRLQERLIYNVFQQYARSGAFSMLYIVDNEHIADFLPDVSIMEHYEKINEVISSTYHMINVFDNSKSVVDTFSSPRPTSRISTFFVFDPADEILEKWFFSIDKIAETRYYYGIPDKTLKEEKALYRSLLKEMKKKLEIFPKVSYGIYETAYESKIGYGIAYTNLVQEAEMANS